MKKKLKTKLYNNLETKNKDINKLNNKIPFTTILFKSYFLIIGLNTLITKENKDW